MMTPNQIEIARKLVAHERWSIDFERSEVEIPSDGWRTYEGVAFACIRDENGNPDFVVDLQDDATAGVLLGMWREAVCFDNDGCWTVIAELEDKMRNMRGDADKLATHMAELFALMLLDVWGEG